MVDTQPYWIACGVTLFLLAVLLVAEWRRRASADPQRAQRAIWVLKPLTSTGFIVAAVLAGATESPYGWALLAALVLSWWGDVLLIPRDKPRVFRLGVLAFLLGHVAFAVAFVVRGVAWGWAAVAAVPLAVVAWLVIRWLIPHVTAELKGAVLAYVAVITTMLALAVGAACAWPTWSAGPLQGVTIYVGALMFYLSDLSVARERFVVQSYLNRVWGLPCYFIAQLILAGTP